MPLIDGALFGIKAAVLVIVVEALWRIGKRALKTALLIALSGLAFIGIFFLALPFPLIVGARGPDRLCGGAERAGAARASGKVEIVETSGGNRGGNSPWPRSSAWSLWWTPVALAAVTLGPDHVLVGIGTFFSKLAVVSFGGAYAVLAYMAQQAVETHHWMTAPEMVDGLGLAETTPGPLILVTQFVGFLAAFRDAAPFSPVMAGVLGAAMTRMPAMTAENGAASRKAGETDELHHKDKKRGLGETETVEGFRCVVARGAFRPPAAPYSQRRVASEAHHGEFGEKRPDADQDVILAKHEGGECHRRPPKQQPDGMNCPPRTAACRWRGKCVGKPDCSGACRAHRVSDLHAASPTINGNGSARKKKMPMKASPDREISRAVLSARLPIRRGRLNHTPERQPWGCAARRPIAGTPRPSA